MHNNNPNHNARNLQRTGKKPTQQIDRSNRRDTAFFDATATATKAALNNPGAVVCEPLRASIYKRY